MPTQIALQLYTLREFTKTPADIARTLARVRQIGYEAVQCSALGPIDAGELATILRNEGLTCCATHVGLDRLEKEPAQVTDDHARWGCVYAAVGGFFPKENVTAATWTDFARRYSAVAAKYAGSPLRLGYHNHSHEWARFDGKPAMQHLLDAFDREIWIELDTYWVQHGGGDPAAWIRKVAGRIPCVHLKDMGVTLERAPYMAEVGEGNLNWAGILDACRAAGVQWHIIEQDDCNGRDPFESAAISLRNVRAMGLR